VGGKISRCVMGKILLITLVVGEVILEIAALIYWMDRKMRGPSLRK